MKTYVLGDIHGAGLELVEIIKNIGIKEEDRLVFVGDLFDRGIHGHVVWDIINRKHPATSHLKNPVLSTLGNHEAKFIRYIKGEIHHSKMPKHYLWFLEHIKNHGVKENEFLDYCLSLPFSLNFGNTIVVHAGINPYNTHDFNDFSCNVYGFKKNGVYWWDIYEGDTTIVYGHLSEKDHSVRIRKNSFGIDTGVVYGGYVTAYCIEDKQIYRYTSNKDWKKIGKSIFDQK